MTAVISLKRVYEPVDAADGVRVLVDRLWPRGLTKERAAVDVWAKEVAPSAALRKTWHADPDAHSPEHFAAFSADYERELASPPASEALDELAGLARSHPRLTLLFGAKDERTNHAVVLRAALIARLR
ncbi:DUF488 family protein [Leucobacter zeae]|nr:DUF488 family protein [Leucobacter zeae]